MRRTVILALPALLAETRVFARVTPEQKVAVVRAAIPLQGVDDALWSLRRALAVAGGLGLLIAFVLIPVLDKVVGALVTRGAVPASDRILVVSGRTSYELVQKAVRAGIPIIVAVVLAGCLVVFAWQPAWVARELRGVAIGLLVGGFLAPRAQAARDAVLAHGVGVFIEGRYLAGIGAILPHPSDNAAEIASLFALTRYVGEGAGGQIVRYAIDRAREEGLDYLFSCTTSERVEGFFERLGFRPVEPEAVPKAKWDDYDPARRERVRCLRFDLEESVA